MALLRDPKFLTYVKDLSQYTFCADLDPNVKMADIAYGPKDGDWCDIEGEPAYEALHWWLKEQSMIFFQDDTVVVYEALRFMVQEHEIAPGNVKVLAFDVDEQQLKLIMFR